MKRVAVVVPTLLALLGVPPAVADGIDPALVACGPIRPAATPAPAPVAAEAAHVDIVFCIDRSHSMDDVIETAKRKVWSVVNEVAKAKPAPVLRIGLVGYGDGERLLHRLDLTSDLDEVYQQLMTYRADSNSGQEFVGHAIHVAAQDMKWSEGAKALKIIYVVGNETARQGPPQFDYARTAPAAIAKGIMVNAVYCGDYERDVAPPTWREFARLADGQFLEIAGDGGRGAVAAAAAIVTPFDAKIAALNTKLNETYVAYGVAGRAGADKQVAGDLAAASLSPTVVAERTAAKAKRLYSNSVWDLVDASKEPGFDLKTIQDQDLPEEVRKLEPKDRPAYVQRKAKDRADVQRSIADLATKRDAYVQAETAKAAAAVRAAAAAAAPAETLAPPAAAQPAPADSFDAAVAKSLREQAKRKGFAFDE